MLLDEADASPSEEWDRTPPGRRCSADVNGSHRGVVRDTVAGRPEPLAEIDVLAVKEEALIPTADPLERLPSHENARAGDPLDVVALLIRARIPNRLVDPGST